MVEEGQQRWFKKVSVMKWTDGNSRNRKPALTHLPSILQKNKV
jgi:hypothetical protein